MDILARRDHSERELREKLSSQFGPEHVQEAIDFARDNKWIQPPEVLAEKVGQALHRKNKGSQYIANYLQKKGLPPVEVDSEQEVAKALTLARAKLNKINFMCIREETADLPQSPLAREVREKIGRFLLSRGFDSATVRKVIYEKL